MEALIDMVKPYVIVFVILVLLSYALSAIIKIMTIAELATEKRAYQLIEEETAEELQNVKNRENREQKIYEEQMKLLRKQQMQADRNDRMLERENRTAERTAYRNTWEKK